MVRNYIIILCLWVFQSQAFAIQSEILINTPKEVIAGNDFLMVINIPANYLEGIARIEFQLPNGFEAKAKKSANADFKFQDQKALFQWLTFPSNEEVEISMVVSVKSTIEGYFVIKASGSYLKQKEPIRIELFPQIITIKSSNVSEMDIIQQQELTKFTYEEFKSEGVACIRQVPFDKDGEIIVNLLVSKGDFNKYGKIQEQIPVGYNVVNIKSQNAIFVYNERQRTVKYMWMNMPVKAKFIVSYKLVPTEVIPEDVPFIIYGEFFYAENNKTLTVAIQERGIELSGH